MMVEGYRAHVGLQVGEVGMQVCVASQDLTKRIGREREGSDGKYGHTHHGRLQFCM
jgi:hypothetical protein